MIIDLHTHSTASDGLLSPVDLLARAELNGVGKLALTDHDTVSGVKQLQQALANSQLSSTVELIAGVEITATLEGRDYHILGLWLDSESLALGEFLASQAQVREVRAEAIDRRLEREGIVGALAGARAIANGAILSRPHFARFLLENGYCDKEQQAYKRWLGAGKVCDVKCTWPSVEAAVEAIHSAGGLAVLAHPDKYGLTLTKMRATLEAFKALGGDGLELISGRQQSAITDTLLRLSHKFELACSMGSDFHSPEQSWSDLGCNTELPSTAVPIWSLPAAQTTNYSGASSQ